MLGQDQAAWIMQGPISDRTTEKLGVTDVGIILYRKILEEQMQIVEDGGEPMNVHRADRGVITLPQEHSYYPGYTVTGGPFREKPNLRPLVEAQLAPEIDANFADCDAPGKAPSPERIGRCPLGGGVLHTLPAPPER